MLQTSLDLNLCIHFYHVADNILQRFLNQLSQGPMRIKKSACMLFKKF